MPRPVRSANQGVYPVVYFHQPCQGTNIDFCGTHEYSIDGLLKRRGAEVPTGDFEKPDDRQLIYLACWHVRYDTSHELMSRLCLIERLKAGNPSFFM